MEKSGVDEQPLQALKLRVDAIQHEFLGGSQENFIFLRAVDYGAIVYALSELQGELGILLSRCESSAHSAVVTAEMAPTSEDLIVANQLFARVEQLTGFCVDLYRYSQTAGGIDFCHTIETLESSSLGSVAFT